MKIDIEDGEIEIHKIFANKSLRYFINDNKLGFWLNDITVLDYNYLKNMSCDTHDSYGLISVVKNQEDYKKNFLILNTLDNNVFNIMLFSNCYVKNLEKDRCLFYYNKYYYPSCSENIKIDIRNKIISEQRKDKIDNLLFNGV